MVNVLILVAFWKLCMSVTWRRWLNQICYFSKTAFRFLQIHSRTLVYLPEKKVKSEPENQESVFNIEKYITDVNREENK